MKKKREEVFSPRQIKQENTLNPHWHKCCITPLCFPFFFLNLSLILLPLSSPSLHLCFPLWHVSFPTSVVSHLTASCFPDYLSSPLYTLSNILLFILLQFSFYSILAARHHAGGQTVGVSSVHGNMPHP